MRKATASRRRGMQRCAGVRVCDVFRDVQVVPEAHEVHGRVVSPEQRDPPPGAPPESHENFKSKQGFNPGLDPPRTMTWADANCVRIGVLTGAPMARVRFSPPPHRGPHGLWEGSLSLCGYTKNDKGRPLALLAHGRARGERLVPASPAHASGSSRRPSPAPASLSMGLRCVAV